MQTFDAKQIVDTLKAGRDSVRELSSIDPARAAIVERELKLIVDLNFTQLNQVLVEITRRDLRSAIEALGQVRFAVFRGPKILETGAEATQLARLHEFLNTSFIRLLFRYAAWIPLHEWEGFATEFMALLQDVAGKNLQIEEKDERWIAVQDKQQHIRDRLIAQGHSQLNYEMGR